MVNTDEQKPSYVESVGVVDFSEKENFFISSVIIKD